MSDLKSIQKLAIKQKISRKNKLKRGYWINFNKVFLRYKLNESTKRNKLHVLIKQWAKGNLKKRHLSIES